MLFLAVSELLVLGSVPVWVLAALTLKMGAARKLLPRDPEAADALLGELSNDIQATVADIRRLVYDLRPPTLDELGLVSAIRERVFSQPSIYRGCLGPAPRWKWGRCVGSHSRTRHRFLHGCVQI
jgi:Histidine kinase